MIKKGIAFNINSLLRGFQHGDCIETMTNYRYIMKLYYLYDFKVYLVYTDFSKEVVQKFLSVSGIPYDNCIQLEHNTHSDIEKLLKHSVNILYYVSDDDTTTDEDDCMGLFHCYVYSPIYECLVDLDDLDDMLGCLPVQVEELLQLQANFSVIDLSSRNISPFLKYFNKFYTNLPLICWSTVATGVDFSDLKLRGAIFDFADLHDAKFIHTDLTYATFRNANISNVNFNGADLYEADFNKAYIHNTDFTNVRRFNLHSLSGACLHNCIFPKNIILYHGTFNDYIYDIEAGFKNVGISEVLLISGHNDKIVKKAPKRFLNNISKNVNNDYERELKDVIDYFREKRNEYILAAHQ